MRLSIFLFSISLLFLSCIKGEDTPSKIYAQQLHNPVIQLDSIPWKSGVIFYKVIEEDSITKFSGIKRHLLIQQPKGNAVPMPRGFVNPDKEYAIQQVKPD